MATEIPTASRTIDIETYNAAGKSEGLRRVVRVFEPVTLAGQPATHIGAKGEGWIGGVVCGTARKRRPVAVGAAVTCSKCLRKYPAVAAELNAAIGA